MRCSVFALPRRPTFLLTTRNNSDELENYLELFLRNGEEMRCVRLLHQIVYTGALATPPEVEEIETRTTRKARRSVAMRPAKETI